MGAQLVASKGGTIHARKGEKTGNGGGPSPTTGKTVYQGKGTGSKKKGGGRSARAVSSGTYNNEGRPAEKMERFRRGYQGERTETVN